MKLIPIIEVNDWSVADYDLKDCNGYGVSISWLGFVFQMVLAKRPK